MAMDYHNISLCLIASTFGLFSIASRRLPERTVWNSYLTFSPYFKLVLIKVSESRNLKTSTFEWFLPQKKVMGSPKFQLPLWFSSWVFLMVFIYETVGFLEPPPRLMVHHGAPWAMGLEVIFRKTGSGCVYLGKWSMGIWSNWKCHLPPSWFSDNWWQLKHLFVFTLILGVSIPFDEPFFQLTPPKLAKNEDHPLSNPPVVG